MRLHILGICGTFMAGIALIAKEMGIQVSGSDQAIYPPMSDILKNAGIEIFEGWHKKQLEQKIDCVIVGNALSRGNEAVEYLLNQKIPYQSGPAWLYENVLKNRHVIAVTGTHGKTSTTALITWILETAGLTPGFLIGGAPKNFKTSARLGSAPFFVIEGDEYDTAFFDKASKFLHYHPDTLILNNCEFDHADIFENIDAIKKQFKNLIRIIPSSGKIIYSREDKNLKNILKEVWTPMESTGIQSGDWKARNVEKSGAQFDLYFKKKLFAHMEWSQCGLHQVQNAVNAVAAAHSVGVAKKDIVQAFKTFEGVKRRLEISGVANQITVYDDFAHHPTAIAANVSALKEKIKPARLIAVLQCGTNTL